VEHQVIGDAIVGGELDQVALGERGTVDGTQRQEAVDQTFDVAHGYWRSVCKRRQQGGAYQYLQELAGAHRNRVSTPIADGAFVYK
jgi:hypothetical protein